MSTTIEFLGGGMFVVVVDVVFVVGGDV